MNRIESFDEYKEIIRKFRVDNKKYYTNNYFLPDAIKRYIDLKRAYYDEIDAGIIFYFDEESCFRLALYVNTEIEINIPKQEKKLYVRTMFKAGKNDDMKKAFDTLIEKAGFELVGTTVQIKAGVEDLIVKTAKIEKYRNSIEKKGFKIVAAKPGEYAECEKRLLDSHIIKDYHIDYMTDDEKEKLIPGSYCYIVDSDNKKCAVSVCIIDGETAHGVGVEVEDEYKIRGFAPVLANHRFNWVRDNGGSTIEGWILLTNENSIRYHESLGYTFTDKHADEWLMY